MHMQIQFSLHESEFPAAFHLSHLSHLFRFISTASSTIQSPLSYPFPSPDKDIRGLGPVSFHLVTFFFSKVYRIGFLVNGLPLGTKNGEASPIL